MNNANLVCDEYFNKTRGMFTAKPEYFTKVRYVVFCRKEGIISGINKAISYLEDNTNSISILHKLVDGDYFQSNRPVLLYEGYFGELINLETTILGYLSFSGCSTNMNKIVHLAKNKPVIDMSARHYPWQIIEEIAYAAAIGGASGTSTRVGYNYVQKWLGFKEFKLYGSLPHAAASILNGNIQTGLFPSVEAGVRFNNAYPNEPLTILIDYEGKEIDVIKQAVKVFKKDLKAIRLDTHGGRVFQGLPSNSKKGVTVAATGMARRTLDKLIRKDVKIIVSSGFNEEKVEKFMKQCPNSFDAIGTGSFVEFIPFTADIYQVSHGGRFWTAACKAGRFEDLDMSRIK